MHTPSEAREKRCCGPHGCGESRQIGPTPPDTPEGLKVGVTTARFCIADECAAWRWGNPRINPEELPEGLPVTEGVRHLERTAELTGFCGLAGKP